MPTDPKLLTVVLKDIVIPELMAYIRGHFLKTGMLPTDQEVEDKLLADANRFISEGQAFLASKGNGD